jgi:hypothetical protein
MWLYGDDRGCYQSATGLIKNQPKAGEKQMSEGSKKT